MTVDNLLRVKLCVYPGPLGFSILQVCGDEDYHSLGASPYSVITREVLEDFDAGDMSAPELLEMADAFENMAQDFRNHLKNLHSKRTRKSKK